MKEQEIHRAKHPWWARLIVGLVMLILSFVGLIVTDLYQQGALNYWRIMVPLFALLSIGLSYYLRKKHHEITAIKIWHEVLHWLGLIIMVYLLSMYVEMGVYSRFQAALGTIALLALSTYLAGVYLDSSFIVIGITLGLFAAGAGLLTEYLYSVMLPVAIIIAAVIIYLAHRKHKKKIIS